MIGQWYLCQNGPTQMPSNRQSIPESWKKKETIIITHRIASHRSTTTTNRTRSYALGGEWAQHLLELLPLVRIQHRNTAPTDPSIVIDRLFVSNIFIVQRIDHNKKNYCILTAKLRLSLWLKKHNNSQQTKLVKWHKTFACLLFVGDADRLRSFFPWTSNNNEVAQTFVCLWFTFVDIGHYKLAMLKTQSEITLTY